MNKISRRSFVSTSSAALAAGMTHGCFGQASSIGRANRSHPAEGLDRENITITDIKVTPLSYKHDGDYLWRCAGLYVWKSYAALVQVFSNKGIVGITEGSP